MSFYNRHSYEHLPFRKILEAMHFPIYLKWRGRSLCEAISHTVPNPYYIVYYIMFSITNVNMKLSSLKRFSLCVRMAHKPYVTSIYTVASWLEQVLLNVAQRFPWSNMLIRTDTQQLMRFFMTDVAEDNQNITAWSEIRYRRVSAYNRTSNMTVENL